MDLPMNVIIILVLCVIVAAVGIIFAMSALTEGREGTGDYWDMDFCIPERDKCTISRFTYEDGCCEGLVCRRESPEDSDRICLPPGREGDTCEYRKQCEEGLFCVYNKNRGNYECTDT